MTAPRRKLLTILAQGKGIDTSLFEHEAEWELCESVFLLFSTAEQIEQMEALVTADLL